MSYLISTTILLFAVWPAYYVLLRYSERYAVNRFLLLLAMVAACALPFVSFSSPVPVVTQTVRGTIDYVSSTTTTAITTEALELVPGEQPVAVTLNPEEPPASTATYFAGWPTWTLIYGFGVALLLLVMGIRLVVLLSLHLRSRPNGDAGYRLLHPNAKAGQAFTFGRKIYFSIDVPDAPDFDHVLAHERVHARQGHSLDILLTELFLCAFWFHPAAWWLRNKTRANLEYLVDRAVLDEGSDRRSYQLALVRQSQLVQGLALTLPFSEPSLKSRIARMTGMPEYRVIAGLAAVALLFWIGAAVLMINGNITSDFAGDLANDQGDYLAASAGPGDPYFDYYAETLPDELYTFELYTRRMLTGTEYLQVRAIVSQFPGARLYLYRQPLDEGYNLELQMGDKTPAIAYPLNEQPGEGLFMMGLEKNGANGQFTPVAMVRKPHAQTFDENGSLTFFTTDRANNTVLIESLEHDQHKDDVTIYVNGTFIDILKEPFVTVHHNDGEETEVNLFADGVPMDLHNLNGFMYVNGVSVTNLPAYAWHRVRVEGRNQPEPVTRLLDLLGTSALDFSGGKSYVRASQSSGTYRAWYEKIGWPAGQKVVTRYNNRQVSLDFLLDTEFGPNAVIHTGVSYDTPMGRYAVQVIDDTDTNTRDFRPIVYSPGGIPFVVNPSIQENKTELDIFLRRMPTPAEASYLDSYIQGVMGTGYGLTVYRDCTDGLGAYSLHVGQRSDAINGYRNQPAGVPFSDNKRIRYTDYGDAGIYPTTSWNVSWPEDAPDQDIVLRAMGEYQPLLLSTDLNVAEADLYQPPARASLECLVAKSSKKIGAKFRSESILSYFGALEYLFDKRDERGMSDRPHTFYIGDRPVDISEFGNYVGGPNAFMLMGTYEDVPDGMLVFQIFE